MSAAAVFSACGGPSDTSATAVVGSPSLARAPRTASTIQVDISGLPSDAPASVLVTGPNGYSRTVTSTTLLADLANGTYTVSASTVSAGGTSYVPTPATRSVAVKNGSSATAAVAYSATAATTGALAVSISMPDATPAAVSISGPNGYTNALTSGATLSGLVTGTYVVTASAVTSSSGASLVPAPSSQSVAVTAGATASAAVAYTVATTGGTGLNLRIGAMYITQSVQTTGMSVPLVAGRDGVLRVFVLANEGNAAQPVVRARFYRNGALVSELTANAPASAVPTSLNEGSATASWNIRVPGSLLTGGLTVLADVDPTGAIAEADEGDNAFPVSGPQTLDVRAVPHYGLRFVPILQSGTGGIGNITDANRETFLTRTRDMHPMNTISSTVRSTYTTSLTLASGGGNWSAVLSELRALRTSDGASDAYYGVVKVGYSSGVAGIGYVGAPTSMGWDYLPSGSEVMAHELGHTFGRQHAPCGGVSGADANFPYAGGTIGVFGFNVRLGSLLPSTTADLMGYCNPTWISDYTYKAVMNFRGTSVASTVTSANVQPGLLVWGRVAPDGSITLEPSARMVSRSVLPATSGSYSVEATDANGAPIFSLSFEPDQVADETGSGDRHFAFIVPMDDAAHVRLSAVRVRGNGRSAERGARLPAAALENAAANAQLDADGPGRARVRWNGGDLPLVVVRNATTGEVLSFARNGDVLVQAAGAELELIVSDGVRSVVRRGAVRGR